MRSDSIVQTFLPLLIFGIVEIARAVVGQPELHLLDEPAAGMNAEETAEFSQRIYRLR